MRELTFLVALLVTALSLSACRVSVEEPLVSSAPTELTVLSNSVTSLPDYDAAVAAIDFDPPLQRDAVYDPRRPTKLLAAVENRGTMPLLRLVVEASITSQKGDFSAQDSVYLERLAPGETRVVEFDGVAPATTLPRSPSFRIRVVVNGFQRDANPQNNSREVLVRVVD